MREGTLVEYIDTFDEWWCDNLIEIPQVGQVYTFKCHDGSAYIELFEFQKCTPFKGKFPYIGKYDVLSWATSCFREIHYNASAISELLEERKVDKG